MYISQTVRFLFALFATITIISATAEGAPNAQASNPNRQNSIVFNVAQYAKVTGPKIGSPPAAPPSVLADEPQTEKPPPPKPSGPCASACVGAIISCCNAPNLRRREHCFDTLNCPGAWITNFCSLEMLTRVFAACG